MDREAIIPVLPKETLLCCYSIPDSPLPDEPITLSQSICAITMPKDLLHVQAGTDCKHPHKISLSKETPVFLK